MNAVRNLCCVFVWVCVWWWGTAQSPHVFMWHRNRTGFTAAETPPPSYEPRAFVFVSGLRSSSSPASPF